ncbi:MAG: hypothetical protein L3K02_09140, partial [Thermoplasmata archaeon]|nr:hypothetical protein [Thermoplasmata archaeon]
ISYPAAYSTYLSKRQGLFGTLGLAEDTWALNEGVLGDETFIQQCLDMDRERESMFFDSLDKVKRGLCVCVFDGTDRLQHTFWRDTEQGAGSTEQGAGSGEQRNGERGKGGKGWSRWEGFPLLRVLGHLHDLRFGEIFLMGVLEVPADRCDELLLVLRHDLKSVRALDLHPSASHGFHSVCPSTNGRGTADPGYRR